MPIRILFIVFFLQIRSINAQPSLGEIEANDNIYSDLVHSLHFNDGENTLAMPILYLNVPYRLFMEFDLLEGSPRRLYYTLRYFEKNWNESPVDLFEVMDGVNEVEINQFQASFNTYTNYVHYNVELSASDLRIKQTGNFLLIVYDLASNVYLTKRIYVASSVFSAKLSYVQPNDITKISTHQSINIELNTGTRNILNPKEEIQMEVLQNGNPMTKKVLHEPLYFSGNNLRYTKDDEILFPAGKEFRGANVRSIQNKGLNVKYWDEKSTQFHCYLKTDEFRRFNNYIYLPDYNGKMVYTSPDVPINTARTRSEYFYLHFKLASNEKLDKNVYVYGLISNWNLTKEFLMTYNQQEKVYEATVYTKNAFIDYSYATTDENNNISLAEIDGDWSEAENDYFVLVYYRPYGGRFDQLLLAKKYNSNSQ